MAVAAFVVGLCLWRLHLLRLGFGLGVSGFRGTSFLSDAAGFDG
jgi:hypothetical protein